MYVCGGDDLAHLAMPSLELCQCVGDLALRRPRLDTPFVGNDTNPIDVAASADEVVYEMAVRPNP
jgi:hypothetical protein